MNILESNSGSSLRSRNSLVQRFGPAGFFTIVAYLAVMGGACGSADDACSCTIGARTLVCGESACIGGKTTTCGSNGATAGATCEFSPNDAGTLGEKCTCADIGPDLNDAAGECNGSNICSGGLQCVFLSGSKGAGTCMGESCCNEPTKCDQDPSLRKACARGTCQKADALRYFCQ